MIRSYHGVRRFQCEHDASFAILTFRLALRILFQFLRSLSAWLSLTVTAFASVSFLHLHGNGALTVYTGEFLGVFLAVPAHRPTSPRRTCVPVVRWWQHEVAQLVHVFIFTGEAHEYLLVYGLYLAGREVQVGVGNALAYLQDGKRCNASSFFRIYIDLYLSFLTADERDLRNARQAG